MSKHTVIFIYIVGARDSSAHLLYIAHLWLCVRAVLLLRFCPISEFPTSNLVSSRIGMIFLGSTWGKIIVQTDYGSFLVCNSCDSYTGQCLNCFLQSLCNSNVDISRAPVFQVFPPRRVS